jgi:hypothetical protein
MHLERLSRAESRIVGEVLRAAADGPFFPDWEFQTLFGLYREEVRRIADEWPLPILAVEDVTMAVNNAFNMLLGYPHRKDEIWPEWISVDRAALNELFNRLRGRRNESHFERLM